MNEFEEYIKVLKELGIQHKNNNYETNEWTVTDYTGQSHWIVDLSDEQYNEKLNKYITVLKPRVYKLEIVNENDELKIIDSVDEQERYEYTPVNNIQELKDAVNEILILLKEFKIRKSKMEIEKDF